MNIRTTYSITPTLGQLKRLVKEIENNEDLDEAIVSSVAGGILEIQFLACGVLYSTVLIEEDGIADLTHA